ncbi:RNA-directed DNA polymerase, eukaryota, reverse transcriptase zinc-binding domain protein [Tanacetum coccineum]
MHHHRRALVKHQEIQYEMKMKMDYHKENPGRTNHVGIYGKWAEFERVCWIEPNKMLRIHYMYIAQVFNSDDDEEEISVFHERRITRKIMMIVIETMKLGEMVEKNIMVTMVVMMVVRMEDLKEILIRKKKGMKSWNVMIYYDSRNHLNCKVNVSESNSGYSSPKIHNMPDEIKSHEKQNSNITEPKSHKLNEGDEVGMNHVLENGPWMVNNKPMFIQKWDTSIIMDRKEPKALPLWVKLHFVPIEAWTVNGISAIASSLGKPLIMDKTTTKMCNEGRGRFGYARVLIEVQAEKEFKEKVEICYSSNQNPEGNFSKYVDVEYSWKPPVCTLCKVFGHLDRNYGKVHNGKKPNFGNQGKTGNGTVKEGFVDGMQNRYNDKRGQKNDGTKINQMNKNLRVRHRNGYGTRVEYRPIKKVSNDEINATTEIDMFKNFKEQWEDKWENGFMDVEDVHEEENGMKDVSENVLNAAWNVRGMCNRETKKEVKKFINEEKLNISWNPDEINIMQIHVSSQSLLCIIETIDSKIKFFCAFIYAANTGRERKELWKNLIRYKRIVNENPWVLMGDWNVSLNNKDHSEGESCKTVDMIDFQECIEKIEIEDLKSCGIHFTWINRGMANLKWYFLKKIERGMGKQLFHGGLFCNSTAHFLPHLSSDHCLAVLIMPKVLSRKKRAFKFTNYVAGKPEFLDEILRKEWNI